jgi:hypothetical protein
VTRIVRINRDRLSGSRIDTVATGGAFDGTLGVLGGIEVMRTLNDVGIQTLRDIEVGFFTEEEGVRFGTDMLGSAVTAGRIPLDHARKLTDADGKTVQDDGGISHTPREYSTPVACANGTDVLANAVLRLAGQS